MEASDWIAAASAIVALASFITSVIAAVSSRTQARHAAESARRSAVALERANELAAAAPTRRRFTAAKQERRESPSRGEFRPKIMSMLARDVWVITNQGPGPVRDVTVRMEGSATGEPITNGFPARDMREGDSGSVEISQQQGHQPATIVVGWETPEGEAREQVITLM